MVVCFVASSNYVVIKCTKILHCDTTIQKIDYFLIFPWTVPSSNHIIRYEFQIRRLYTSLENLDNALLVVILVTDCEQKLEDCFQVFGLEAALQKIKYDLAV